MINATRNTKPAVLLGLRKTLFEARDAISPTILREIFDSMVWKRKAKPFDNMAAPYRKRKGPMKVKEKSSTPNIRKKRLRMKLPELIALVNVT
jgi:hypothetical protein